MDAPLERTDTVEHSLPAESPRRTRIVVIGAGFAGLTAAMRLKT